MPNKVTIFGSTNRVSLTSSAHVQRLMYPISQWDRTKKYSVLLLGNGGRESALQWKLIQSRFLDKLHVSPSPSKSWDHKKVIPVNFPHSHFDFDQIAKYCKENGISMVIPGSEELLATGITDALLKHEILCFGPTKAAAEIEASKAFSKAFMKRHGIPTPKYESFTSFERAKQYVLDQPLPLVIKASGLALGKGVVIAYTQEEAITVLDQMMNQQIFNESGKTVVIEEFLNGEEVSILAFSDGKHILLMPSSQDHKRIFDGNKGPNTGGMGAYSPVPWIDLSMQQLIQETIIQPTIEGLFKENAPFHGVIYAGLMIDRSSSSINVLEFNARFGDPETQAILPLFSDTTDLLNIMYLCCTSSLDQLSDYHFRTDFCSTVVLSSNGYPDTYEKNVPIFINDDACNSLGIILFHAGVKKCDEGLVTNGGRVLAVTCVAKSLLISLETIYDRCLSAGYVRFSRMHYRRDIGKGAKMTYSDAGVSIDTGNAFVDAIKPLTKRTRRTGTDASIGGFGGIFDLGIIKNMRHPLLISSTDGVGTKLFIAIKTNVWDTIGLDLVAMNVNDLLVQASEPLFFLDYYATGKLKLDPSVSIISGISEGCLESGCALIGGETAEMPGLYKEKDFDLAGFAVGIVDKEYLLPKEELMEEGDLVIGISSSGFHSNGYSLVRHIVDACNMGYDQPWTECLARVGIQGDEIGTLGQILLEPTIIYVPYLLPLLQKSMINGMAHITGGGFLDNIPRVVPKHLDVVIDSSSWELPSLFRCFKRLGNISGEELARTWNCGIGMVLIIGSEHEKLFYSSFESVKESLVGKMARCRNYKPEHVRAHTIGRLVKKSASDNVSKVTIRNAEENWQ